MVWKFIPDRGLPSIGHESITRLVQNSQVSDLFGQDQTETDKNVFMIKELV